MRESLGCVYSFSRVKDKHVFKEINSCQLSARVEVRWALKQTKRICILELVLERPPLALWKGLDKISGPRIYQLASKLPCTISSNIFGGYSAGHIVGRGA
jgi:hypothetical protein